MEDYQKKSHLSAFGVWFTDCKLSGYPLSELSLRPSEMNPRRYFIPRRADVINATSFRNFTAPYRVDAPVDTEFKTGAKGAHTHMYFIRHSFEPLNELRRRAGPLRQLLQILRQLRL